MAAFIGRLNHLEQSKETLEKINRIDHTRGSQLGYED